MVSEASVAGRAVIDLLSPNCDSRPAGRRPRRHAGPALHRHGVGRGGARTADGPVRPRSARTGASARTAPSGGWCPRSSAPGTRDLSEWRGRRSVNDFSIGIELDQSRSRARLPAVSSSPDGCLARSRLASIVACHPDRPPQRGGAHSDIAPKRRQDPGEFFDWASLAKAGIGLWPRCVPQPVAEGQALYLRRSRLSREAAAGTLACYRLRPCGRRRLRRGHGCRRARLSTPFPSGASRRR